MYIFIFIFIFFSQVLSGDGAAWGTAAASLFGSGAAIDR